MSVVVAIKDKDRILVGCDSQVTCGWKKLTLDKSQKKIWKPEDDEEVVMGLVGAARDSNLLMFEKEWINDLTKYKKEFGLKYVVEEVVPKIFSRLKKFGRLEIKNDIQSMYSDVLFAYKDRMYAIYGDGGVIESKDFLSLGSGNELALGSYESIKDSDMSTKDKVIACIKAACHKELFVNYPIIVMNTKNDEITVIDN